MKTLMSVLFGCARVAGLVGVLISGCASAPLTETSVTPSVLQQEGSLWDGRSVEVVGWITVEPESYNLWTSKKDMRQGRTIHCVSLASANSEKYFDRAAELNRRKVRVVGKFVRDIVGASRTIRFAACSRAALEPESISLL
jgi:hypothetical protein